MREIKFRGRRLDNGKWVTGDLLHGKNGKMLISTDTKMFKTYAEVDPATVGQYTGLKDCNGVEIYEGDIVMQRGYSGVIPMVVRFEQGAFIVGWHGGSSTQTRPMLIQKRCEVIGNVIENPDSPKRQVSMTEERYQYLNSLSIEDYDNQTSYQEQKNFCEYQQSNHPEDVIYLQCANIDNDE